MGGREGGREEVLMVDASPEATSDPIEVVDVHSDTTSVGLVVATGKVPTGCSSFP